MVSLTSSKSTKKQKTLPLSADSNGYALKVIKFIVVLVLFLSILALFILEVVDVIHAEGVMIRTIPSVMGVLLGVLGRAFLDLLDSAPWETYLTALLRKKKISTEDDIRISYATCVIVEVEAEYLLLYNDSVKLYLLPAMTYSLNEEDYANIKSKFGARDDDRVAGSHCDYRFLVPVKNIKKFYKDFCKNVDALDYDRTPIVDRIVETCGINPEVFKDVKIELTCRDIRRVEKMRYTGYYEMNVMDVCKLVPTAKQKAELVKAKEKQSKAFKFVDMDIIEQNGIDIKNKKYDADIMSTTFDFINIKVKSK